MRGEGGTHYVLIDFQLQFFLFEPSQAASFNIEDDAETDVTDVVISCLRLIMGALPMFSSFSLIGLHV